MTDHQHPTAKPEGEGAPPATYGDKGRALYDAFWKRNGGEVPSWNDQARAIRSMWMSIARDAEPLYASPPVPAVAGEARQATPSEAAHLVGCEHQQAPSWLCDCPRPRIVSPTPSADQSGVIGALARARAFIDACAVESELTPNDNAENPCELVNAIDQAIAAHAASIGQCELHTLLMDLIREDLHRQHPDAFTEDTDIELVIPSGCTPQSAYVKIGVSDLAEVVLPYVQPNAPNDAGRAASVAAERYSLTGTGGIVDNIQTHRREAFVEGAEWLSTAAPTPEPVQADLRETISLALSNRRGHPEPWPEEYADADAILAAMQAKSEPVAWLPEGDFTQSGQANPVIVAVPNGEGGWLVGEAWKCVMDDDDPYRGNDGWWWAGTAPGDYHNDPIRFMNHGDVQFWQPLPADPSEPVGPDYKRLLGNLLARVHRDGGHRTEAVGWEQAVEEADALVAEWLAHPSPSAPNSDLAGLVEAKPHSAKVLALALNEARVLLLRMLNGERGARDAARSFIDRLK